MEDALAELRTDVSTCVALEQSLRGKPLEKPKPGKPPPDLPPPHKTEDVLKTCLEACRASRKRAFEEEGEVEDLSTEAISQYTRFTDGIALKPYERFLHYVPRLVNVVRACDVYVHITPD